MRLGQCSRHSEYLLTLLGYTVGAGAVWKFPYLVARHGGGSFLIPYLLFVMIGALPLTYLEMFIGQYSQNGPIGVWDMCPAVKGLGVGAGLLSGLYAIYYPTFFSWILYYLFFSFFPELPWRRCGQSWNTRECLQSHGAENTSEIYNTTTSFKRIPGYAAIKNANYSVEVIVPFGTPSSEEFFRNDVLQMTNGLENLGSLRWPLVLCLALTFLVCYIWIIKGIRISGKIVYVTVICPYILITVFFVRSCMLPGALDGFLFYITPDFDHLQQPGVWLEACGFALYSMGISYGFMIAMAGHNPMSNNSLRDAFLVNIVTTLSQLYFGMTVFTMVGHLAYRRRVDINFYRNAGFKLPFITYPEAALFLPVPQLWSVLLFLMWFTLGIDSLIPCFEVVINLVGHWFPALAKRCWLLNAVIFVPCFLLALPYTAQGGIYLLTLVEWFAYFPAILLFAITECIVVGWVYGTGRISKAMIIMQGAGISKMADILWKYICPLFLTGFLGFSFYSYRPPIFEDYIFPAWANIFGWLIFTAVVLPLPVYFVWSVCRAPGNTLRHKLEAACKPQKRWDIDDISIKKKTGFAVQDSLL